MLAPEDAMSSRGWSSAWAESKTTGYPEKPETGHTRSRGRYAQGNSHGNAVTSEWSQHMTYKSE